MASFQSPSTEGGIPSILPTTRGVQRQLFRFYRARPEGRNVYIFSNDTVSENDPDGDTTVWNIQDRSADSPNAPYVTHVFWGGHDADPITAHEQELLEEAGYTVIP